MDKHLRALGRPLRMPLLLAIPVFFAGRALADSGSQPTEENASVPDQGLADRAQGGVQKAAALVGNLTVEVPAASGAFVVHGTLPIGNRSYDPFSCPFMLMDPSGTLLDTQWHLVAQLVDGMVVELRAVVPQNKWSGFQTFQVVQQPSPFHLDDFDLTTLATAISPGLVEMEIRHQDGSSTFRSLTGFDSSRPIYRIGPATVTLEQVFDDAMGGGQCWTTVNARKQEIEFIVNWNNGTLPAQPDLYFDWVKLKVPAGWTWTSFLPDPAVGNGYLVMADDHVIPQRMERSFRVIVHPTGVTPDLSYRGWAAGDWSLGGYLAPSAALPDLDFANLDLTTQKEIDYDLLANNEPTVPGDVPVSFLWPAQGVKYGGMTGGIDIDQYEGVRPAATGQVDGLLSLYVEQLRYGSRQMGCIYEGDGRPIEIEDYANPNGTLPWSMFNHVFQGNPPDDEPFYFSQTGPGVGSSSYDPLVYLPIDDQHMIRRTKANKALAWLDNDPLARLYIDMDATLQRMSYYEGPGGQIAIPSQWAEGLAWGRAEAWAADVLVTSYALGDTNWRNRHLDWFVEFTLALYKAQMPNGLFSSLETGKVATSPPYGHRLDEVCLYGIHGLDPNSSSEVADFLAHRGNEQVFLLLALEGIMQNTAIDTTALIKGCGEGLWNLAWKSGTDGVLDRYPVGPVNGAPYTNASQIPVGLTSTIYKDSFHVGTAISSGLIAGGALLPALYAYTYSGDLTGALAELESRDGDYVENYAPLLALLQSVLP